MSAYPKKKPTPGTRGDKENQPPARERAGISSFAERGRWPIFVLYALLLVWGVINHESWADEAQAWLLARDLTLTDLFKTLPSEGHPPLWYLLLMPFAKLGAPYATGKWIAALAGMGAVYLLMFRSNMPLLLKLLVPFSYFFFYKYAVFARSYCLILLFTAAIISLYPKRFEKPWLFAIIVIALFNTHMLMFSFCAGIAALFLIDAIHNKKPDKTIIITFVLMCAGGLYLLPYIATSATAGFFGSKPLNHWEIIQKGINSAMFIEGNTILAVLVFILCIILLTTRTKALALVLAGLTGALFILSFKYSMAVNRHFGVLFVILTAAYGIAMHYKDDRFNLLNNIKPDVTKYGTLAFSLVCLVQIPQTVNVYKYDIEGPYSGAKEAAEFILDHQLEQSTIVGYRPWAALAVLPYLPEYVKYYNAPCNRFESYYIYDSCFMQDSLHSAGYIMRTTYHTFKDKLDKVVFLFNFELPEPTAQHFTKLYSTPEAPIYASETYHIYKFKGTK